MSTRTMYLLLTDEQFCTKTRPVSGGRFCYIAPNYIRIYDEEITDTGDTATRCHAVEVPESDIKEQQEGTVSHLYLWKGPHDGRYNELDTSTLPISTALGTAMPGDGVERAPEAEALPVPLDVRFSAAVLEMTDEQLDSWPNMGEVHVKEWRAKANGILDAHAAANK